VFEQRLTNGKQSTTLSVLAHPIPAFIIDCFYQSPHWFNSTGLLCAAVLKFGRARPPMFTAAMTIVA
jgi:hypothetical protein